MKTGQHIDALNSAIAEAKATLRDMHECDGAVASAFLLAVGFYLFIRAVYVTPNVI